MWNEEKTKLVRYCLLDNLDKLIQMSKELKDTTVPCKLSLKSTFDISNNFRDFLVRTLQNKIDYLIIMLDIIDAGEGAELCDIVQTIMSNYCMRHSVCKFNYECENYDETHAVLDCPECSYYRNCQKCLHADKCRYLYDTDTKHFYRKANLEKAALLCSKIKSDVTSGDIPAECLNCDLKCKYTIQNNTLVYRDDELVQDYTATIARVTADINKLYTETNAELNKEQVLKELKLDL